MSQRSILVVVVDGLRASALGAYGNTTYATPALDEFAAESLLFDWCYAPSAELTDVYRALWYALHPARASTDKDEYRSLPRLLADSGYATTLVTDEPRLKEFEAASHIAELVELAPAEVEPSSGWEEVGQTAMARCFAAASEAIASRATAGARLVWLHARGMRGAWDAPIELQRELLDEGDPPPVESVLPPDAMAVEDDDPDAAFRYSCAYAAQIIVVDSCWRGLLEALRFQPDADEWLVILLGARGFSLGEHRRIGGADDRLYGEQLHVPWLVRFPDRRGRLARRSELVTHCDLPVTLVNWIGAVPADFAERDGYSVLPLTQSGSAEWRDALIAASGQSQRALRTPEWCLRQDTASSESGELYVRPDDRWEANDVAKLCPDVVDKLSSAAGEALQNLARNEPPPRSLLAERAECV